MWFYFRKANEGLKTINPDEPAPSMRLLAYGKLELHGVAKKERRFGTKAISVFSISVDIVFYCCLVSWCISFIFLAFQGRYVGGKDCR